ncbi:prepilin-type N-terminal cleavage/methylation domain-containing protein [Microseira sp. BLCC-F43]|uniref:prepilin-type N-terminal cleavage/methylation domain-containing protein n=1 Tax=Microseira sp. BLCC-F43 TaxID=3153602 RepID=UPI0035B97F7F
MATKLFLNLFRRQRVSSRKRKNGGFTVIELLISMLIASIVITVLLNLMIDLLQTDRREYARTETQREMQMAMDFIVNDLREAVYVYDNDRLNESTNGVQPLKNFIPERSGYEPILAFWKPEPIDDDSQLPNNCSGAPSNPPSEEWTKCRNLWVKRRIMTLVVYYQTKNEGADREKWKGISRIMRYTLRQYEISGSTRIDVNAENPAYVEPLTTQGVEFSIWPFARVSTSGLVSRQGARPTDIPANSPVLVDFLDHPVANRPDGFRPVPTDPRLQCPTNYTAIPPQGNPSGFDLPSFAVCVSKATPGVLGTSNKNQDVIVFLRGNPTGKAGVKIAPLLAIRTQAVARGVVDKTPVD